MPKAALIVDDSTTMLDMVAYTLSKAGFEVTKAGNGQEGLTRLTGKRFDLIITDLNMPIMDGITFIKKVRSQTEFKFTPVLLLTTEGSEERKKQGRAAGATGWLTKPFNPNKLLEIIKKVVP
jgi:two-component system chemotaxis response regulator CheY